MCGMSCHDKCGKKTKDDKSVHVSIVDTRSESSQVAVLEQEIDRSINI